MYKHLIIIVLLIFSLVACDRKSENIEVGFMGTLSGKYSDLGQATLQGVMIAFEEFDKENKLSLVVKDDFGIPKEGVKVIDEFSAKGIKHVIGPNLSSVASAVVSHVEGKDIHIISPSASTSALAGKMDNFMRTMPHNNYRQTDVISDYLIKKLKIDEVVVLYDAKNASYSNDVVKKFAEAFMSNGGVVKDVRAFNSDSNTGFSDIIMKDKGDAPKMYYVIGAAIDSSLIIWQIKKAGFASKILIRAWAASNEFYRLGGDAVEGVYLFDYYIDKTLPDYKKFRQKYVDRYKKEPSWMSVYGYECARMVAEALCGEGDFQESVVNASKNNKILKGFHFDEYGDAYLPLHFFNISGGEIIHKEIAE